MKWMGEKARKEGRTWQMREANTHEEAHVPIKGELHALKRDVSISR